LKQKKHNEFKERQVFGIGASQKLFIYYFIPDGTSSRFGPTGHREFVKNIAYMAVYGSLAYK